MNRPGKVFRELQKNMDGKILEKSARSRKGEQMSELTSVIRIIMNVLPEKQKEILQTLMALAESARKESGCLSYGIFHDIEDRNVFNLISEWETRGHLDNHVRSDRFSVLLGTKSLLCEPMKIQIFTVSDSEGIEAVNSIRKKMKQIFPVLIQKGD